MWKYFFSTFVIFALCCAPVFGQQRGQRRGNPGVSPQTIMDTAEVRVTRVQLEAVAVRPSHVHNEGPFHMFIPITSPVEIFFGPEGKEVRETVAPGQVQPAAWIQKCGFDSGHVHRNFRQEYRSRS